MRIWHIDLLKYLPKKQFDGQLRELVLIMRDWRDKGKTNHVLINKVMEYPKNDLVRYFIYYEALYRERYGKFPNQIYWAEFKQFDDTPIEERSAGCFDTWHTKDYLRSNMANLWEKHFMGVGESRITDAEWETLLVGYENITGEEYVL